jgi:hypothetical protein
VRTTPTPPIATRCCAPAIRAACARLTLARLDCVVKEFTELICGSLASCRTC